MRVDILTSRSAINNIMKSLYLNRKAYNNVSWAIFPIETGRGPPAAPWQQRPLIHSQHAMSQMQVQFVLRKSYMFTTKVLVASQVIPVQLAVLMHALSESLQFGQRSVPGRSQRSNSAAASAGLSFPSENEHLCEVIITIVTTKATNAIKSTYNPRTYQQFKSTNNNHNAFEKTNRRRIRQLSTKQKQKNRNRKTKTETEKQQNRKREKQKTEWKTEKQK